MKYNLRFSRLFNLVSIFPTGSKAPFITAIIPILFLISCAELPTSTDPGSIIGSVDKAVFTKSNQMRISDEKVLSNEPLQKYLDSLVLKISKKAGATPTPKIVVVDTTWVQCSVRFSHEIYISKGMLFALSNEAQLVALIGHEIGHLVLKHDLKTDSKAELISSLVGSVTGNLHIQRQANDLVDSHFNKEREREADEFGTKLAFNLGYRAKEFSKFFDKLLLISRPGVLLTIQTSKSNHKSLRSRSEDIKKYISSLTAKKNGLINASAYRNKVGKIVSQVSPSSANELAELRALTTELKLRKGKLTFPEFIAYMQKARTFAKSLGTLAKINDDSFINYGDHNFLSDPFELYSPIWEKHGDDYLALKEFLVTIAHVGVGNIPVVGDAVDLYEILAGRDFITDEKLSVGDRVIGSLGLLVGSGKAWREASIAIESATHSSSDAASAMAKAREYAAEGGLYGSSKVGHTYNAHLENGPLTDPSVLGSFSGGKYTAIKPSTGETFYRVGGPEGNYWSRTEPNSQVQTMSENAILPHWNDFSQKSELQIPKGFKGTLYEGTSSNMSGILSQYGSRIPSGSIFHGGGNQVYIPDQVNQRLQAFIKTKRL